MQLAKKKHCAMILVGHVTKDGAIAGQKFLNILLIQFYSLKENEVIHIEYYARKRNRFGSTNEIGIFENA